MDLESRFAHAVVETNYDDLPEETVLSAKMAILDTLGVMLAGSGAGENIDNVWGVLDKFGGTESCTVIQGDKRTNPVFAAMANGCLAHSIDYDDAHDDAFVHPSASTVPAALTIGEYAQASGKELIVAVALGNDVMCRLGFAVANPPENSDSLWMAPILLGTFSATTASAKLLKLNLDKTENAYGIAYSRAGGSKQVVIEPGALRGLYAMFPNMTGVLSALLAENGVPGLKETFNGPGGFFNMYYKGVYDESAFDDMGLRFEGDGVSIKPWPCCRFTNSHVDAALRIAKENDVDPSKIKKIVLYYEAKDTIRCLEPFEARKAPQSIPEAKISLPFTVAQALAYRKIEIGDFSAESLKDPLLLDLCEKTEKEFDASLASDFSKTMLPGRVSVEMQDGTVYDKRVDIVYGHPKNRMQWEDLAAKFRDCASYSRRRLTTDQIDKIIDAISNLEEMDDISKLVQMVR